MIVMIRAFLYKKMMIAYCWVPTNLKPMKPKTAIFFGKKAYLGSVHLSVMKNNIFCCVTEYVKFLAGYVIFLQTHNEKRQY